jgi:hypothetical protein
VYFLNKKGHLLVAVFVLFLLCMHPAASSASPQSTTGTILGVVTDQSGAIVPGVEVTVKGVETGSVQQTIAGDGGTYRFPGLAPGTYEVQAALPGFQTSIRTGITLTVGREAVVDFSLQVGNIADQITVTGEAPLIESTTATVSGVVDPVQIRELPLNARSFLELAPLQAGVVVSTSPINDTYRGFGTKLSVVGTRGGNNEFLLDGASITDATGTVGSAASTMAGVETVREFRIVTNAYDAEYGKHTGAVVVAVTRSGTNEFHGSLFEFLRNSKMDARNFFDRGSNPPPFKRNQFGGTFGGPIKQDKLFFFGGYEGLRERLARTNQSEVPGMGMRAGIIGGQNIGVAPNIKPFLDAYPLPTGPDRADGTAPFLSSYSKDTDQDTTTIKIDHTLSSSDSLFGRFNMDTATLLNPQASRVNFSDQLTSKSKYITLEETHVFSPSLIMRTNASYVRTHIAIDSIIIPPFTVPTPYYCGAKPTTSCAIQVTGITPFGSDQRHPARSLQNMYQLRGDINYTTGAHSLKIGAQGYRFHFNQIFSFNEGGSFTFSSPIDFLRGDVSRLDITTPGGDGSRGWRQSLIGMHIQDDFRVNSRLTLNFGVRYEAITVPTEAYNKIATIRDISPAHWAVVRPDQTDVGEPYFKNPSLKNFAPRAGFAWDPIGDKKTVIRGGGGVYHDQLMMKDIILSGVQFPPFYSVAGITAQGVAPGRIDFPYAFQNQRNLLLAGVAKPQVDIIPFEPDQPVVYKWSLNIQRQLLNDLMVDVGYSGTRSVHLMRVNTMWNTTPLETRGNKRYILMGAPLANPLFDRTRVHLTDSTGDYHAFLLTVDKRLSRGLQIHGAYTYSKSTDDSSGWVSADYAGDRAGYGAEKDHALSAFDIRHSLYTSFTYDLPGRSMTGVPGRILGGWSLTGLARLNSGSPTSVGAARPQLGVVQAIYVNGASVDLIPGGNQNSVRPRNPNQYFDVTQFAFPDLFAMGNIGRNTLITPGIANFDATFSKSTALPVGEDTQLQFRAEFYNVFNRANFGVPNTNLFDRFGARVPTAGQITSTRTPARQIQLALKLIF